MMQMIWGRDVHNIYFWVIDQFLPILSTLLKLESFGLLACQLGCRICENLQYWPARYFKDTRN